MADTQRITVGIPAYKAQNTILRTLCSIALQNIVEDLDVVICNDADGIGYQKYIDMFSPYMSIKEITLDKNVGPGSARQAILDSCENPLITFIDADDTFSGGFALKTLRMQLLAEPYNACCWGNFLEEQIDPKSGMCNYLMHPPGVWMFGELFKREFLTKYNIRFLDGSRSNEDSGFNMKCRLCSNQFEQIKQIQDIIYYWHWKENSITRFDNANYSYNRSFQGITRNWIDAIKHSEKQCPFNGQILQQKVMCMINLYEYWIETIARDNRYEKQNWNCCRRFYAEVYREIKDKINDEIFSQIYNDVMRNCYMGNKLDRIIPVIGIKEFMDKLEKEYDPKETEFDMTDDTYPYESNKALDEKFKKEGLEEKFKSETTSKKKSN